MRTHRRKPPTVTATTRFHLFEYANGRCVAADTFVGPMAESRARTLKAWLIDFNRGVDERVSRKIGRPYDRKRTYEIVQCDERENCTPCWDYDNRLQKEVRSQGDK